MKITGNDIKRLREERMCISQRELGEMLGVNNMAISNWERCGDEEPRMRPANHAKLRKLIAGCE